MDSLPAQSVHCVLTDLPYGTTANKWDVALPLGRLWSAWRRVIRPGAPVILFTQQPFTTAVGSSNLRELKTEWIWIKTRATGHLNAKKYPMKKHENILVFCDRVPPYFPQKSFGHSTYKARAGVKSSSNYGHDKGRRSENVDGSRFPTTILSPRSEVADRGLHPTQKPLELVQYRLQAAA
jgi:site-specific DNA-methyltransferase (adenine-specific)